MLRLGRRVSDRSSLYCASLMLRGLCKLSVKRKESFIVPVAKQTRKTKSTSPVTWNSIRAPPKKRIEYPQFLRLLETEEELPEQEISRVLSSLQSKPELDLAVDALRVISEREISIPFKITLYNTLLERLCAAARYDDAFFVLRQLHNAKYRPISAYTILVNSLYKANDMDRVFLILIQMRKRNVNINILSFPAIIQACIRLGKYKSVLEVLESQKKQGILPNPDVFRKTLLSCLKSGETEYAMNVVDYMKEQGLELDITMANEILKKACKENNQKVIARVLKILDTQGGYTIDIYNTLIFYYYSRKEPQKAMNLIEHLQRKKISPNRFTVTLLRLCTLNKEK